MAISFIGVSALQTEDDNTGTTIEVNFPTNVEGDLLLAVIGLSNASTDPATTMNTETGWTLMTQGNWSSATAGNLAIFYRLAPAGGITQTIFDSAATTGYVSRGFVYRGVDQTTPIDVGPNFNNNVWPEKIHP